MASPSNTGPRLKASVSISEPVPLPRWQLVGEWCLVYLIAASLAVAIALSSSGLQLSNWLFDRQVALSAPSVDDRILLVAIDEPSLARLGNWPWPRSRHAALIERLSSTRAVGYDVLFNEPTSLEDDASLARAMASNGRVTVPVYLQFPGSNGRPFDLEKPIPEIEQAVAAVGHVNIQPDSDGLVRRVALVAEGQPHFTVSLLGTAGSPGQATREELVIPYNRAGAFPSVSAISLIDGEVPDALIKDRIVLVGATAAGLGDSQAVPGPAGSIMPGVEVQANIINALLNNYRLRDVGPAAAAGSAVVLLLFLMLVFWRASPSMAFWLTVGTGLTAIVMSAVAHAVWHLWLTPIPLVAGLGVAYPLWSWRRLSALDRFVARETSELLADTKPAPFELRSLTGFDAIALAANRLHRVIGEMRERRKFLSDVIESSPDALAVVDNLGIVRMANRTAKQVLGEEVEGTASAELFLGLSPEGAAGTEEFRTRDGKAYLFKTAQLAADGVHGGQIIRLADITARRIAERDREDMLEFLSHDMRGPQANIVNLVETARAEALTEELLDRISDNARFSLKLADDFVQLARLSHAAPTLDWVDLTALADEAADRAYAAAKAHDVSIEVTCDDEVPLVRADPWLLMRVLGNLLDNAIKYSEPGGVVTCAISHETGAGAASDQVACSIIDRGPGIAEDRKEYLFERFGSVDQTKTMSAGLGLAFVKKAMDAMDASVECRTGPGGTTFELRFLTGDQSNLS